MVRWLHAATAARRRGERGRTVVVKTVIADEKIAASIVSMLERRACRSTMCPSEVARALMPDDEGGWRALMPRVRAVAAALAIDGLVVATRNGVIVDATSPGGPIRLARRAL